ncbi:MAG: 4Fe-4S binding protein, partial [Candidatus Cloacimonadaceae bacterium]|nr:4Fe-4S binding protein [Candidatus Cloacimonadaceae bacterium]
VAVRYYKPMVDRSACTGCSSCEKVCPVNAVQIVEEKAEIADSLCIDCRKCVKACPHHAIRTPQ